MQRDALPVAVGDRTPVAAHSNLGKRQICLYPEHQLTVDTQAVLSQLPAGQNKHVCMLAVQMQSGLWTEGKHATVGKCHMRFVSTVAPVTCGMLRSPLS